MTENGRPVGLIETMRAEGGEVPLLDLHLARLEDSALSFGYPLDRDLLVRRIHEEATTDSGRTSRDGGPATARLRLVLWPDGTHDLTASSLSPEPFRSTAIYPWPIREAGTWRCTYKTTARAHYDRALAWAASVGVDEPVLLNTRGEVSEGARTNVVVRRGRLLVTPPLSSGGLDGVLRRELLRHGAHEEVLTPRDLEEADEVLLVNALRGRMSVELLEVG